MILSYVINFIVNYSLFGSFKIQKTNISFAKHETERNKTTKNVLLSFTIKFTHNDDILLYQIINLYDCNADQLLDYFLYLICLHINARVNKPGIDFNTNVFVKL